MPTEPQPQRKTRTARIIALLKKRFPDAKIALNFSNPLELLVATILSAQCTDVRVNVVTPALFKKYRWARDFARADLETLQEEVRSTGFFRNKAKSIKSAATRIVEAYDGQVPETMEELLTLSGVARKTANVVLGNAFGKNEGVVVDTHVRRLSQRLGLTKHDDPEKIEQDLMQLVPRRQWADFAHLMIFHGRNICFARKPNCAECPLNKLCPSAFKV